MEKLCRAMFAAILVALAMRMSTEAAGLPPGFEKCSRKDPNINACLSPAIEKAIRTMKDGIPSLHLLPIDPLDITRIRIEQGGKGPVSLALDLSDMKLTGLANLQARRVNADIDKKHFVVDVFIPLLTLYSTYVMEGKFLVLPVTGKGKSVGKIHNAHIHVNIECKSKVDNGIEHWDVDKFDLKINNVTRLGTDFENLFNGNEQLAKTTIAALNEEWPLLWDAVRPSMELAFGTVLKNVANVIFSAVPEKDLLLD